MFYTMYEMMEFDQVIVRWTMGDFLIHRTAQEVTKLRPQIFPCTIYVDDTVDLAELVNGRGLVTLYRAKAYNNYNQPTANLITPWYLTKHEVDRQLEESTIKFAVTKHQIASLYPQRVFPIKYPHEVTILRNEKGLYSRIETHPERTGKPDTSGKIFFPDTSSRGKVCPGPAIVHSVYEKPTFGFMRVTMQQFEAPDDDAIVKWLQESTNQGIDTITQGTVHYYKSIFGTHARVIFGTCIIESQDFSCPLASTLIRNTDGSALESFHLEVHLDYDHPGELNHATETKQVPAVDLITQSLFTMSYNEWCDAWVKHRVPMNQYMRDKGRITRWAFGNLNILTNLHDMYPGLIQSYEIPTNRNEIVRWVHIDLKYVHKFLHLIQTDADWIILQSMIEQINRPAIAKLVKCGILKPEEVHHGMV